MKTREEQVKELNAEALARLGDPKDLLFFDIETTGLSIYNAEIYLIGAVFMENGRWVLRQWLSDSFSSEEKILRSFLDVAASRPVWVHYNGDTFDVRFIQEAVRQYGLSFDFDRIQSIDLYKCVQKLKHLLPLTGTRQKNVEAFLGINREDRYSGGELIRVYHEYLEAKDEERLSLLFLHNHDDLLGLLSLTPVLFYRDAMSSSTFNVLEVNTDGGRWILRAEVPGIFPVEVERTLENGMSLRLSDSLMTLSVPVRSGTLRHYFTDHQHYYYLPAEGYAVHKLVASGIDPAFREAATKETAFSVAEGPFVEALPGVSGLLFKTGYGEKPDYIRLSEAVSEEYLSAALPRFLKP